MFGFFILRKLFDIPKPPSVVLAECGHIWSPGLCRNVHVVIWSVTGIFLHSPVLLFCGHIGLNKTKHRNKHGISTLNSLLTLQFNVLQKCYEFKLNIELLKTCVNTMNTL